jgi:hypothetical protein
MEIDLSKPIFSNALVNFTEAGAKQLCPFCIGRMIASVKSGDRLMILQGVHAGQTATVSAEPGWTDDEFLVHFDGDKPKVLTRVNYTRDKFCYLPLVSIPSWLCHLSIDDLSALEDSTLHAFLSFAGNQGNTDWANHLLPLISIVRQRRLPIASTDIWPMLLAHGFSKKKRSHFVRYFDFAIRLLVSLHGRPAVQRKKMPPMSRGRYLTPGQQEYYGPSPGITS